MGFLTATTLISAHGAGITMAAGTRFTLKEMGQPEPKADPMSNWCDVVLFLATRCLYQGMGWGIEGIGVMRWGVIWLNISLTHRLTKYHAALQKYHSWPLDAYTGGEGGVGASRG